MLRYILPLLLTASVAAQNVTISVIATEDTRIRLGVTDTLSPRPATLEVRSVPQGDLILSVNGTTPAAAWLPGLTAKTNYDFTAIVGNGPSQEAVAVQAWTTWFSVPGDAVKRAQPLIASEIDGFLTTLAASAEVRGPTYVNALRDDLTAAYQRVRTDAQARRRSQLEEQLANLEEL